MKKSIFSLLAAAVLLLSGSLAEKPAASREYFENLDKDSRLEDIVEDIGQYGIEGSGILYFVWHLDDGTEAKVVFDSKGCIVMIYIVSHIYSERIYKRQYIVSEAGTVVSDIPDAELQEAISKMSQAVNEKLPASARMFFPDPTQPDVDLCDITGDGYPELFTNVTWGSGMVRTDLVVYDPVNEALYVLDGYDYDYIIEYVEDNRIIIRKEGPHGYGDPVTKTYGTVKLEDGKLIFIR
ncbi:MAG: hypothetical protein IJK06_02960 [Clostridia bacterium]|nr:hypothetical protein [Clostridia bacterium]